MLNARQRANHRLATNSATKPSGKNSLHAEHGELDQRTGGRENELEHPGDGEELVVPGRVVLPVVEGEEHAVRPRSTARVRKLRNSDRGTSETASAGETDARPIARRHEARRASATTGKASAAPPSQNQKAIVANFASVMPSRPSQTAPMIVVLAAASTSAQHARRADQSAGLPATAASGANAPSSRRAPPRIRARSVLSRHEMSGSHAGSSYARDPARRRDLLKDG